MQEAMPQEIEVRYILPAIRRELASILINENKLNQKEAASILGLTEAAISQYKHSKRAKEVIFNQEIINEIKKSAKRMMTERKNRHIYMAEMKRISSLLTVRQVLCGIHRSQSKNLETCNVCFEDNEQLLPIKIK